MDRTGDRPGRTGRGGARRPEAFPGFPSASVRTARTTARPSVRHEPYPLPAQGERSEQGSQIPNPAGPH